MIHSTLPPAALAESVKRRLAEKASRSGQQVSRISRTNPRWSGARAVDGRASRIFFGLLAAVLGMAGLYGVMSYIVGQRRNEIGIRLALGAHRSQVVWMVIREVGLLLAVGIAMGTVLALWAGALGQHAAIRVKGLRCHNSGERQCFIGGGGYGCRFCAGVKRIEGRCDDGAAIVNDMPQRGGMAPRDTLAIQSQLSAGRAFDGRPGQFLH